VSTETAKVKASGFSSGGSASARRKVGHRRRRGSASFGAAGRLAQRGDRLRVAGGLALEQVGGDAIGRRAVLAEKLRRSGVVVGALAGGQVVVDRRPHDRVGEGERLAGPEDLDPGEAVGGRRRRRGLEARERCRLAQLDVVAQDRHGAREGQRLERKGAQAAQDGAGNGLRAHLGHPAGELAAGGDAIGREL
jgi:hypothetical protein